MRRIVLVLLFCLFIVFPVQAQGPVVFKLTDAQISELEALRTQAQNGDIKYGVIYRKLAEWAEGQEGVDPSSIIWLKGAADVNEDIGPFSDFIRTYTSQQKLLRFGETVSKSEMDQVSNEIAEAVISEVLALHADPTMSDIPTIDVIANKDATPVATAFFNGDKAGWSGNPLFLPLGHDASFRNNIIETPEDAYDLLASVEAAGGGLNSLDDWPTRFDVIWEGVETGYDTDSLGLIYDATDDAFDLLENLYDGFFPSSYVFSIVDLLTTNIFLGRINQPDTLQGSSRDDFVHGGGGDDTLRGTLGDDVLDGGDGTDTADYSSLSSSYRVFLMLRYRSAFVLRSLTEYGNKLVSIENIIGSSADDTIAGDDGNNFLDGNSGNDKVIFVGDCSEYDITAQTGGTWVVSHARGSRVDGVDTIKNFERLKFKDGIFHINSSTDPSTLCEEKERGQDVSFVIDTTGSMRDDIDAVKAESTRIIEAIFSEENDLVNSRIAIVGYKDPGQTSTILSFTDHPDPEDRKTAATDAINGIYVSGGGDIPEGVNSGLLHALNGRAGVWRESAVARRIILFGDAPPKDTELADAVSALSKDVNLNINISSTSSAEYGFHTVATVEGADFIPIRVEIFTVLIGDYEPTAEAFETIAEENSGTFFEAEGAEDLVDVLIEAINAPPASQSTLYLPLIVK